MRAGEIVKADLAHGDEELLDNLFEVIGREPQKATDLLIRALVTVIDQCIKPEAQLAAAQGVASALIANYGCEHTEMRQ